MKGFIYYNEDSPLIPPPSIQEYTLSNITRYIAEHRDLYKQYKDYVFRGIHDELINEAMHLIFDPRKEPTYIGGYVYILNYIAKLPSEYAIEITRPVYTYEHVHGQVYRQVDTLDIEETYQVYKVDKYLMYIGKQGSFIQLENPDDDVSMIVN